MKTVQEALGSKEFSEAGINMAKAAGVVQDHIKAGEEPRRALLWVIGALECLEGFKGGDYAFHALANVSGILVGSNFACTFVDFKKGVEIVSGEGEGEGTIERYTGEHTIEELRDTLRLEESGGDRWAYARPIGEAMHMSMHEERFNL